MNTRYIGNGLNTEAAETVEGFCVADIYATPGYQWFNQKTSEYGEVARKDDGELHFSPSPALCECGIEAEFCSFWNQGVKGQGNGLGF